MAEQRIRGARVTGGGVFAQDSQSYSAKVQHVYRCTRCHRSTLLTFAAEAEIPDTWECRYCSAEAVRLEGDTPVELAPNEEKGSRTHWDMLLERRTRDELEEILEERLRYLRQRRGSEGE